MYEVADNNFFFASYLPNFWVSSESGRFSCSFDPWLDPLFFLIFGILKVLPDSTIDFMYFLPGTVVASLINDKAVSHLKSYLKITFK